MIMTYQQSNGNQLIIKVYTSFCRVYRQKDEKNPTEKIIRNSAKLLKIEGIWFYLTDTGMQMYAKYHFHVDQ